MKNMAKYDEYGLNFYVTHYFVASDQVYVDSGAYDERFPNVIGEVQIGIDESTTQTGICIANMEGHPLVLIDCINRGLPKAEVFLTLFRRWVNKVFPKMDIRRIIYEEINQNAPQQYARKRLMQVVSILEDYVDNCETDIELVCINNKVWKKHLLADPKYDGMRVKTDLVKTAVKEAVEDLLPGVYKYRRFYYNGDSTDAVGIIYGYTHECFIDEKCKKYIVNNTMKPTPLRSYSKDYYDLTEFTADIRSGKYPNIKMVKYNPNLTLEDNCLRSLNYNPDGVVLWGLDDRKCINIIKFDANREICERDVLFVKYSGRG